jgi:hypothetical protein
MELSLGERQVAVNEARTLAKNRKNDNHKKIGSHLIVERKMGCAHYFSYFSIFDFLFKSEN